MDNKSYTYSSTSWSCAYHLPCGYCTITSKPCLKEAQINHWDITCSSVSTDPDAVKRTTTTCSTEGKE